jgi:sulfur-carrier protein
VSATVRVTLPQHLRTLAGVDREVRVDVGEPVTVGRVVDALEERYPVLRGTIRDHGTLHRRDFVRFFACGRDLSLDPVDEPLPKEVATGKEPFRVVGAMAGG